MAVKRREMLFITRKWPPAMGGMEIYSARLAETLARTHSVALIALPGRTDGAAPGLASLSIFAVTTAIRLLFRKQMPELVHIGDMASWPFALIARIRRPSVKIAISAHGTDVSYGRRSGLQGWLYRIYLRAGSYLLPSAIVIANSKATADAVGEAGYHRIETVPLATDIRGRPDDVSNGPNLLFAGRLVRRKGLSWFVNNVLDDLPSGIGLNVAGSKWDKREAQSLEHPKVNYLGILDQAELTAAYASALCVIVPNIEMENGEFEGFGLVATEAAAAGGIVLAAASGGLKDAVIDAVTGFLLPSGEPDPWIEKIREIADWTDERRLAFANRAMREAKNYYSWDRVAAKTVAAYPP